MCCGILGNKATCSYYFYIHAYGPRRRRQFFLRNFQILNRLGRGNPHRTKPKAFRTLSRGGRLFFVCFSNIVFKRQTTGTAGLGESELWEDGERERDGKRESGWRGGQTTYLLEIQADVPV